MCRRTRPTASAISSWPRGCRSFCGAAFRTTSCSTSRSKRQLQSSGVLERQVRRMLADPRADALVNELRRAVAVPAQPAALTAPAQSEFPDFDEACARRFGARPSCSSTASCARTAACSICCGRLHLRQRAAGPALRHSERQRQPLPARHVGDDSVRGGLLGQGSILTVTSLSRPHLAGGARQVDSREPARHAAAAAAAERAGDLKDDQRQRHGAVDARADGAASRQPGLRELSFDDGPARLRARELRRGRPLADARRVVAADRRVRRCCPTARRSTGAAGLRQALLARLGPLRDDADREAADLRARPRARVLRRAGGARDRARRAAANDYRFSSALILGIVQSTPFQMRGASGDEWA